MTSKVDQALNRNKSETGALVIKFELKVELRVVLTLNIDFKNVLVNCNLSTRRQH